jgi:hypothetical protein
LGLFDAALTSSTAALPLSALRQSITTVAPSRASSSAVTLPRPLLAPVTSATLPCIALAMESSFGENALSDAITPRGLRSDL